MSNPDFTDKPRLGVIEVSTAAASVGLAIPERFFDLRVDGYYCTPELVRNGTIQLRRWSDEEITSWRRALKRYDLVGSRIARVARRLGRAKIRGGVIGWAGDHAEVPFVKPPDSTRLVSNCTVQGMGPGGPGPIACPAYGAV